MKILRHWFDNLFVKMFSLSLLLSLLLFSSLMFYTVLASRATLVRQAYETNANILNSIDNSLSSYFQNIKNVLLMITQFENVQLKDNLYIQQMLNAFSITNRTDIGGIYLIKSDESVIADNQVIYDIVGDEPLLTLYKNTIANPDVISVSRPYYSPMLTDTTIAFMRGIRDPGKKNTYGVCVIEANIAHISEILMNELDGRHITFIGMTSHDVFSYDSSSDLLSYTVAANPALDNDLAPEIRRKLVSLPIGNGRFRNGDRDLITRKEALSIPGFYGVLLYDAEAFHAGIMKLVYNYLAIGIVFILLLVASNLLLSKHFTDPIHALAERMDRIGKTARMTAIETTRNDEIGILYRRFRYMLKRMDNLMKKQKRMEAYKRNIELQLLRAQLKPHFLCNTLACVGSLSKKGKNEDIQRIIRSLIILLLTSLEEGDELIPLEKELEFLQAYIAIQQIRFGSSFEYECLPFPNDVPITIPKLLLIPIVENAIVHGLSRRREGGRINVAFQEMHGDLLIRIKDNGSGIDPARMNQIEIGLSNRSIMTRLQPAGRHSIGIKNVHERIRLHYGMRYGISLISEPGNGTEVTIRIPVHSNRKRAV